MKTTTANSRDINILRGDERTTSSEYLMSLFRNWRQRVAYYSVFAAVPAMLASYPQDARSDEGTDRSPTAAAGRNEVLLRRRAENCAGPDFLRGRQQWRPVGNTPEFDMIAAFSGGSDSCPGTAIPSGTYTAAAPFIGTGNTNGANDTIVAASCFYYSFYYQGLRGPDLAYSFTITGRGANPQIKVTSGVAGYQPAVYVLDGRNSNACPVGTNQYIGNCLRGATVYDSGTLTEAVLTSDAVEALPLNVPLHLFVDSYYGPLALTGGPYTLSIQGLTIAPVTAPRKVKDDYDGDGKADLAVFRPTDKYWYVNRSQAGFLAMQFGLSSDQIVPGDFDGDGKTDIAVWRPSTGYWYIQQSTDGFRAEQWGVPTDLPVQGDFDGDGRSDIAVWRPSSGHWFVINSGSGQQAAIQFGNSGDKPVPGDYNADGKADIAIYRPSNGTWYIMQSLDAFTSVRFGLPSDKPVPADYDGDGRTDPAVYRDGDWYVATRYGLIAFGFGLPTDIPVPADYDGDGQADGAVYRDGTWYIRRSSGAFVGMKFGLTGDRPGGAAYLR